MADLDGLYGAYLRRSLVASLGRHQVEAAIQRGELRRLWPGVVVESARLLDPLTRGAAALLAHGPRAVISGPTAAWLHGCTAVEPVPTHVLVPYGHASRSRGGLVVHNGRPRDEDIVELRDLRVLSLEHVVTDLLCTARPRDALAVTDQALATHPLESREVFRGRVAERLRRRHDPRGTRIGARLLGLASGRAESPAESWLLLEVVDLGFPQPEVNWSIRAADGRELYRLDLAWPDQRVAVEYDGYAFHADRAAEDQRRALDLHRRGWIVIAATADDLRDSRRLEAELRGAMDARFRAYRRLPRPA